MKKRFLPLSQVYRLLEPGPVVLVTTADGGTGEKGRGLRQYIRRQDSSPRQWNVMVAGDSMRLPSRMK